ATVNWRGLTKIVTTVVASAARAWRISARWPSCSQPIVGTTPTGRATPARAERSAVRVRTTSVKPAAGSEVAIERDAARRDRTGRAIGCATTEHLVEDGVVHPDGLRRPREGASGDIARVPRGGVADLLADPYVRTSVLGDEIAQADEVGDDLDLAAAPGAGADPDGRHMEAFGDGRGELLWDELEDHREGACLLDRERIGDQGLGLLPGLALDTDLARGVYRLWRAADVAHDRDAGSDQGLDDPRGAHPTFDLDRLGARLAQKDPGVLSGLVGRGVGQERHVGDDQRAFRATDDGLGVVDHLGHRHLNGRRVAKDDLA